jgi:hypothetical protein
VQKFTPTEQNVFFEISTYTTENESEGRIYSPRQPWLECDNFRNGHKNGHRGLRDRNFFVVVTRSGGDKLHYQDTIPEEDLSRLKNWIRCGDPTGLTAEWREVQVGDSKWKAHLAGENQDIDCSGVMDEMFVNEGGKTYTYACTGVAKWVKITHPEYQIRLSNILSSFYKLEKLTSVQVSIPESSIVRPRVFLSLVASPLQNKSFTIKLAQPTLERHQVLWL